MLESRILDNLLELYGYNEPIFLKEVDWKSVGAKSKDTLRKALERGEEKGVRRVKFLDGVFYFSKPITFLKNVESVVTISEAMKRKYVETKDGKILGYYGGPAFANGIHLTEQVSPNPVIYTKKVKQMIIKRYGKTTYELRPARVRELRNEYIPLLQVLDLINDFNVDIMSYFDEEETNAILREYVLHYGLTDEEVDSILNSYPPKTVKEFVGRGIYREIIRRQVAV
jgi:hypothetical protein